MRKYIIVDKITGVVENTMQWGDDRDFPSNIVIEDTKTMFTIDDKDTTASVGYVYNFQTNLYSLLDIVEPVLEKTDIEKLKDQISAMQNVIMQMI